jgi:chromosome segregation ATPase
LQEVLQEALGLIRCWQQQKVIIALLQQRLQQLVGQACSTQRHVSVAQRELQQLQAERDQSAAENTTLSQRCEQLAEQLQKAQQDLGGAASDQQSLQQRLEEALAELGSSKEALAKLQVWRHREMGGRPNSQSVLLNLLGLLWDRGHSHQKQLQTLVHLQQR